MKIFLTLFVSLFLSVTFAQEAETIAYEVDTRLDIKSLRLSLANDSKLTKAVYSIGDCFNSMVCLHLDPNHDYELMVNNTVLIEISSRDIQQQLKVEEEAEVSPISLITVQEWAIGDE